MFLNSNFSILINFNKLKSLVLIIYLNYHLIKETILTIFKWPQCSHWTYEACWRFWITHWSTTSSVVFIHYELQNLRFYSLRHFLSALGYFTYYYWSKCLCDDYLNLSACFSIITSLVLIMPFYFLCLLFSIIKNV